MRVDGVLTVKELVDKVNSDPRRGDGYATSLTKIRFDDIAVARLVQQDLTPESVPEKAAASSCATTPTSPTGGTATDVTDECIPGGRPRHCGGADRGPARLRRGRGGEGVLRPLEEQNGGIVEVNAARVCACTSAQLRQVPL